MITYAQAGVDQRKIGLFKRMMREACMATAHFPLIAYGVTISPCDHGVSVMYGDTGYRTIATKEEAGALPWIAEWMYEYAPQHISFYERVARANALSAIHDVLAHGAMPVAFLNAVVASDSDWFTDLSRAGDLARGYLTLCKELNMALGGGESGSVTSMQPRPPVHHFALLSGTAIGIILRPYWFISGDMIRPFDRIIGVASSGLHANGSSLVIALGLTLPDQFLTKLASDGRTLGEEALTPMPSYVKLIEELLRNDVKIHRIVPGTGGGVSKLASHPEKVMYRIYDWPKNIPLLFTFLKEQFELSMKTWLTTFNCGIGYYFIVPPREVARTIEIGTKAGYELMEIGWVEESNKPHVYFEPAGLALPPPGA